MEILYPLNFSWAKFALMSAVLLILSFLLVAAISNIPFIDRLLSIRLPKILARNSGLHPESNEIQGFISTIVLGVMVLLSVLSSAFLAYPNSIYKGSSGWELDNNGDPYVENFVLVRYDNVVHTRVTLKMVSNGLLFEDYYLGPSCHGIALIKPNQLIPLNVERSVSPDGKVVMYDLVSNLQYTLCPRP